MARPTKPDAVKLSETARFRVTKTELERLEELAQSEGLSLADFCRSRLLNVKPRRKKATPERLALIALVGMLGNIRSDLNQLLKDRFAHKFVKPERAKKVLSDIETSASLILNNLGDGGS